MSSPSPASQSKAAIPAAMSSTGLPRPSDAKAATSSGTTSGHNQGAPANSAGDEIASSNPYQGNTNRDATPAASQTVRNIAGTAQPATATSARASPHWST